MSGELMAMHAGVYRVAGAPVTWRQAVLAAVLANGPGAMASHRTAAALHECEDASEGVIEVLTPRHRRARGDVRCHESRDVPAADCAHIDSIPVTAIDRTLIDVGRYWPPSAVGKALDFAVRFGHTTYPRFQHRVWDLSRQGRNGIGTARRVLEDRGFGDGWGFEKAMMGALREAGLPTPVREFPVKVAGKQYYIDFAYPDAAVGIECDSTMFHTLPHQRANDARRQNEILGTGLLLLRYPSAELRHEREMVQREIRENVEQRTLDPQFRRHFYLMVEQK